MSPRGRFVVESTEMRISYGYHLIFGADSIDYGISMYEDTIETVRKWSREKKMKNGGFDILSEVQQFHRFCHYH